MLGKWPLTLRTCSQPRCDRPRIIVVGLILLVSQTAGPSLLAADKDVPDEHVLVRMLGSRDHGTREQASQQLFSLGTRAIPILISAQKHPEPEIRIRARQLVQRIQRAELDQRVKKFLVAPETASVAGLPGWSALVSMTGDSKSARQLFGEMLRSEQQLLALYETKSELARSEVETRLLENGFFPRFRQRRSSLGTLVTELLIILQNEDAIRDPMLGRILYQFVIQQPLLREAAKQDEFGEPVRRILGCYVADSRLSTAGERLKLGAEFNLPDTVQPAYEIILRYLKSVGPQSEDDKPNPSSPRVAWESAHLHNAILTVGKWGKPEDLFLLSRLLEDRRSFATRKKAGRVAYSSRVQDVALLAMLHLTEQSPEDYGFQGLRKDATFLYAISSAGFPAEEKRQAALDKWERWESRYLESFLPFPANASEGVGL